METAFPGFLETDNKALKKSSLEVEQIYFKKFTKTWMALINPLLHTHTLKLPTHTSAIKSWRTA